MKPILITLDFESILIPEAWLAIADATGITALRKTTRDVPDFDALMRERITTLREHGIALKDIDSILEHLEPLAGAGEFLDALRSRFPVLILSDSFMQFVRPLLPKLSYPTVLCHTLTTDEAGYISGYQNHKGKDVAVKALQEIGYSVRAVGDSFNDIGMLTGADRGFLFHASEQVRAAHPDIPVLDTYEVLKEALLRT